jgi:hypothetical protein
MLAKFSIDYVVIPQHNQRVSSHPTNDPVEAAEVLMHLLLSQAQIKSIRHDGVVLPRPQFDRMLKVAAERIVSELLRESLHIEAEEVKERFGFAA